MINHSRRSLLKRAFGRPTSVLGTPCQEGGIRTGERICVLRQQSKEPFYPSLLLRHRCRLKGYVSTNPFAGWLSLDLAKGCGRAPPIIVFVQGRRSRGKGARCHHSLQPHKCDKDTARQDDGASGSKAARVFAGHRRLEWDKFTAGGSVLRFGGSGWSEVGSNILAIENRSRTREKIDEGGLWPKDPGSKSVFFFPCVKRSHDTQRPP